MKTALKNHLDLKLSLTSFVLIFFVLAAFSQEKKVIKRDIIIKNGDTLINGKKLSEVDRVEQVKLRKELHSVERSRTHGQGDLVIKKRVSEGKSTNQQDEIITHDQLIPGIDDREMKVMEFKFHNPAEKRLQFNGDSLLGTDSLYSDVKIRFEGPVRFENRLIARNGGGGIDKLSLSEDAPADFLIDRNDSRFKRQAKNAQTFNYTTTDNDGISTRVSFHVHEVDESQFKKIAEDATIKKMEDLKDLTLHPNFSTGKTTVSFQLPVKGSGLVKVLDSSLKVLYADKTSKGVFNKQVLMPKNGIYYLTIYQNKSWFVRQIVKD